MGSVTEPIRFHGSLCCSEVRLEENETVLVLGFFKLDQTRFSLKCPSEATVDELSPFGSVRFWREINK